MRYQIVVLILWVATLIVALLAHFTITDTNILIGTWATAIMMGIWYYSVAIINEIREIKKQPKPNKP